MAVSTIVAAIVAVMDGVSGVDNAPANPPAILGDVVTALVYPQPGSASPQNHRGKNGRIVISYADTVVVEVHRKLQNDLLDEGVAWLATTIDATRAALWRAYADTKLDGTVTSLATMNTQTYGNMSWGTDETFGFRLTLDVTYQLEA